MAWFSVGASKADSNEVFELDIPSQRIESALSELAEKTNSMLLFPYETVQLERSKPVSGVCTLNEALSIMLHDTSLRGDLTAGGVITISQANNQDQADQKNINNSSLLGGKNIVDGVASKCRTENIEALEAIQPIDIETNIETDNAIEQVLVTGSNIKRKSYDEAGSPVNVLARSDLDADAPNGRIVDILRFLPSNSGTGAGIVPGGDGGPQEGRLGGGTVDIRGLGGNATLVLLNGQRSTAFPVSEDGRVDINSLVPGIFLDRVELLKDGASGVYGSDAVAGVVNFITRDRFEGIELRADARGTIGATVDAFDHNNQTLGVLFGSPTSEDVHIVAGFEYFQQDNLVFGEVKQVPVFDVRGASSFGNPGSFVVPIRNSVGEIVASQTVADPDCQAVVDANINADPNFSQTATSLDSAANLCRITFPNQPFLLDEKRLSGRFQTTWDINESLIFKQAFSYARSEVEDIFNATTPVLNLPTVPGEHPANPFIAVDRNGNQLFAQDADNNGIADRDSSGNVILDPNGIAFNEDVLFRGRPYSATNFGLVAPKQEVETSRIEFGLQGEISDWSWNLNWNTVRQELIQRGPDSVLSEFQAALNGNAGPDNDLFYNPFGSSLLGNTFANDPSLQENISVILVDQHISRTTTLGGVISGELFDLPAGPLSTAFGFQIRNESLSQDFDQLKTIREVSFFGNGDIDFTASERVTAGFLEAGIPVMDSDIGSLDISLAGRFESISGGDTSFNPKFSFELRNQFFAFIGSYATSFLSPSLFQTGGLRAQFDIVTDPISGTSEQVSTLITGNSALENQESTSNSLGLVFTPTDDFSIELGYWYFDFENLVAAPTTQSIVNADPLGDLIERNTSGIINIINRPFFNAGSISTNGLDFKLNYALHKADYGNIAIQSQGTFVNRYDVLEQVGGKIIDGVGSDNNANIGSAIAKFRSNTRLSWEKNNHSSNITARYRSDVDRVRGKDSGTAKSEIIFDAQYSYTTDQLFRNTNLVFTVGARNIFNNEPNIVLTNDNQYFVGTFQDPAGRVIYTNLHIGF
ncbi:MAG: TonB-dependent receptor plug domain-containing protein [Acidiferrobacterales bacterium]|nr:TonB-dependent receptor plug domain-containing protein [Acidiferrobacterales bacterium]